ncbi:MAG TPA: hypothetical protein VFI31_12715 [Pirellulales bacterium]|nr:hypothetical protein [Pirellulales bacterium]
MPNDLVTIASFPNAAEAEVARLALDAEGIKSCLADEGLVTNVWLLGNAVGYVKLQVAVSDAERAQVLLGTSTGEWPSDAEEEAFAGDEEETESPITAAGDEEARRAWRAAIFGVLFCPPLLNLYSVYVLIPLEAPSRS